MCSMDETTSAEGDLLPAPPKERQHDEFQPHGMRRWMQTCDPSITRPDHFAYKRALPAMQGWYDYRLCYRQSATERLRSIQVPCPFINHRAKPPTCEGNSDD